MSEPDIRTVPDHGACKKGITVFVWREAFLGMEKSCPTVCLFRCGIDLGDRDGIYYK